MKSMRTLTGCMLVLLLCILFPAASRSEGIFDTGLSREKESYSFETAQSLMQRTGSAEENGIPKFHPSSPQPLNAYMVTATGCRNGVHGQGMKSVDQSGISSPLSGYLEECMKAFTALSNQTLRFVGDPDKADILFVMDQQYEYAGEYDVSGGSGRSKAFGSSCIVTFTAVHLSGKQTESFSIKNIIPEFGVFSIDNYYTDPLFHQMNFWASSPAILNGGQDEKNASAFIKEIFSWYPLYHTGSSYHISELGEALLARGLANDGSPETVLPQLGYLQTVYGLPVSNTVDEKTLIALTYDPETCGWDVHGISAKVGSAVQFGKWGIERDPDPIVWDILAEQDGTMLLLSRMVIDCQPYHAEQTEDPNDGILRSRNAASQETDWAHCTLRQWLNTDFASGAFTEEELDMLVPASPDDGRTVPAADLSAGDLVTLLSEEDVIELLPGAEGRACAVTQFARGRGVYVSKNICTWWLRTPDSEKPSLARCVKGSDIGSSINEWASNGVRPAILINSERLKDYIGKQP